MSGIGNLAGRSLAIVRELWMWRQAEAERRDVPPRRVLRDDLIVELAKRKSDQPDKIKAIRGMQQTGGKQAMDELADCIRRGLEAPLDEFTHGRREAMPSQLNLLGQFLSPALSSICRSANVATSLAGTAGDVRDLIAYRLEFGSWGDEEPPLLAQRLAGRAGRPPDRRTAGRPEVDPHRRPAERTSAGVRPRSQEDQCNLIKPRTLVAGFPYSESYRGVGSAIGSVSRVGNESSAVFGAALRSNLCFR